MKQRLRQYLIHLLGTVLVVVPALVLFGLANDASLHYSDHPRATILHQDGPYAFLNEDSTVSVSYVSGSRSDGYSVTRQTLPAAADTKLVSYYVMDSSSFAFPLKVEFAPPKVSYADGQKILAISDIEGNYRALRDFLIASGVIDQQLSWTFGRGHLVLVGDFVDRGMFVTQVLWLIYRLEYEAVAHGGQVHFIVGNHELKAMQGDYLTASPKYFQVAAILGHQQVDFYGRRSILGRWLESKNALEVINGVLFVHGGIHPDLDRMQLDLDEVNQLLRRSFRTTYFPRNPKPADDLLHSTQTGPSWYRGYFKANLTQAEVNRGLDFFDAKAVVVGHTLQSRVKRRYMGRVIGIDVRHPSDDHKSWPSRRSEGLFIEDGRFYRVHDTGERTELK
jgi:hypothetical protein